MKILNSSARIIAALGLLVNAYIHFALAEPFDSLTGTLLSVGDLFRIQAVANILFAIAIVVFARPWISLLTAALAGAGIVMLIISVYSPLDLSGAGLPVISEAAWYPDKLIALGSQGVAIIAAVFAALSWTPLSASTTLAPTPA